MRYFRAAEAIYEQVRTTLNAAWGLPDGTGTETCYIPAEYAPRDTQGRVVLAVNNEFCAYPVAVDLLPQLLAQGVVDEITLAEYQAALPQETPPA